VIPDFLEEECLVCRLGENRKANQPCTIVIYGATGDLTSRKLIPALYHLFGEKLMPAEFRIIGFARREKTSVEWRTELRTALDQFSRTKPVKEEVWSEFSCRIDYHQGDLASASDFAALARNIGAGGGTARNLLHYLATQPTQFAEIARHLSEVGLLTEQEGVWRRLIVEKPFGQNLESAHRLNQELTRHAREHQILRIDHYLGKETVQNLMTFRFSNSIFERLWTRDCIEHVQITVSEKSGVGGRGGYYEESGALRDMVQNHLLQVLAMVTMEPPASLEAECIRDEKVKLLRSIRPIPRSLVAKQVVRGQYAASAGSPGYRQEPKVNPASNVETYVALKLFVDNWRWSGVPFYLRTGKNLPLSVSEIRVQFRRAPHVLFAAECGPRLDANSLTIRLQPKEGITLRFNGKVPGVGLQMRPVRMHFRYDAEFGAYTPEAYERLLLDALTGDATLFIRRDEVEAAWALIDEIRAGWKEQPLTEREFYTAGTWGPTAADDLLAADGLAWREPSLMNE
jgi:glucose-6-phosphate 1-dehydrogenase